MEYKDACLFQNRGFQPLAKVVGFGNRSPGEGRRRGCAETSGMNTQTNPPEPNREYETSLVATNEERTAIFAIRMIVFVEEQAVPPEEELDAYDVTATHFLTRCLTPLPENPTGIVATARLIDKGSGTGKIGRVAVLREYRGRGIGSLLMRTIEAHARDQGYTRLILEAQCHAIPFYEKLGYIAEGDIFLDAGIEHRLMHRAI